jgi:hypothetical protein
MKAITAILLWFASLFLFLVGLEIQKEGFDKNYIKHASEEILR